MKNCLCAFVFITFFERANKVFIVALPVLGEIYIVILLLAFDELYDKFMNKFECNSYVKMNISTYSEAFFNKIPSSC